MTVHTPFRCAHSAMSAAPTAGAAIVLLDTGNYPSFSSFLNQTWTFTGTDWSRVPVGILPVPASGFAILAGSGITNTGPSVIIGDIGTFPTTTETGFGSLTETGVNHDGDSVTQAAKTALTAQYVAAQGLPGGTTIAGGTIGTGTTLSPGVYTASSSLNLTGGTVTLDAGGNANATWVFQIGSTLVTASGTSIVLANGAQAANVTWAVGSSATLGTTTNFVGSILALTSITDNGGAVVAGRLLARNGAVTLNDTTVTVPAQNNLFDGTGPVPGRNEEVMCFDGYNVMLYGGFAPFNTGAVLQDTWVWNGSSWTKLGGPNPPGPALTPQPSGRFSAEAAYVGSHKAVMFGGTNTLFNLLETWLWDGYAQTWSQVTVANGSSPAARVHHVMAGDGATTALLFGGEGTNSQFNDTWTYTVAGGWTKLAPATSPSVRSGACMSYDGYGSVYVMFGGKNEYNYLDETWIFNGTTWSQVVLGNGVGPSARVGAQMAFDSTSGRTILFGGVNATTNYPANDTWSFNALSNTWTQL